MIQTSPPSPFASDVRETFSGDLNQGWSKMNKLNGGFRVIGHIGGIMLSVGGRWRKMWQMRFLSKFTSLCSGWSNNGEKKGAEWTPTHSYTTVEVKWCWGAEPKKKKVCLDSFLPVSACLQAVFKFTVFTRYLEVASCILPSPTRACTLLTIKQYVNI